ncbi:MAG TPA: hypothetical protein VE968_07875 [Sphingomicrobium sp.]|nr:hypothetical protein [Sphingomicrobium sp.]
MRNAARFLIPILGVAALAACHKQHQNQVASQDMSIEDNLSDNGTDSNASIETLPPDESSTTSNGELNQGEDNPDVNDVGNGD